MEKLKLKITLEVLNEVTAEFPETIEFIEERLEHQSVPKKIYQWKRYFMFLQAQKKRGSAKKIIFYFVVLGFRAETFSLELDLTKHVKRYNIKLKFLGYDIYLRVIWIQFNESF